MKTVSGTRQGHPMFPGIAWLLLAVLLGSGCARFRSHRMARVDPRSATSPARSTGRSSPPASSPIAARPQPMGNIPAPAFEPVVEPNPDRVRQPLADASMRDPRSPAPVDRGPRDASPAPTNPEGSIAGLVRTGMTTLESLRNYQVRLTRQERVRGTLGEPEQVLLSVRREPFAVRLEWPEGSNAGREVLYSRAECAGMMHIHLAPSLLPLPPMQLAPESPLAMGNSRYPIDQAGLLNALSKLDAQVAQARAGDAALGSFELLPPTFNAEFGVECHEILRTTPDGDHWRVLLEAGRCIPILIEAHEADGSLLERYEFREFRADLDTLDAAGAFDPKIRFARHRRSED